MDNQHTLEILYNKFLTEKFTNTIANGFAYYEKRKKLAAINPKIELDELSLKFLKLHTILNQPESFNNFLLLYSEQLKDKTSLTIDILDLYRKMGIDNIEIAVYIAGVLEYTMAEIL